ncbi:MAG TPA: hypothetical protein IAC79_06560 [Candidatus Spyradenecus faecavium]|uniref:Uncharacterized protein n=1 Tax=Candidatus Spyradenecus faecavium TaxID=2840947 RepID=A0A9D1NPB1_9BACT|nr:hypothetical protein [Candidatus Spyradenecus faecavium]
MKKRRNDAWDAALTEAQRWEAYERSKGVPWPTFADWCAAEFGVRPGKNAIYDWQAWMRRQEGAHRLERAIAARQELKGLSDYAALDGRTADAYLALANDAILSGDPEKAAKIVAAAVQINAASLRLAEQRQQAERLDLQRQELALKRERFEAAERRLDAASGVAADETLSEAERLARIKAIFGLS